MEIKVEEKNRKYGNYLKEILCGKDSDLVTFLLFKYEYMYFNKSDNLFASNMNKLSNDRLYELKGIANDQGKESYEVMSKEELAAYKNNCLEALEMRKGMINKYPGSAMAKIAQENIDWIEKAISYIDSKLVETVNPLDQFLDQWKEAARAYYTGLRNELDEIHNTDYEINRENLMILKRSYGKLKGSRLYSDNQIDGILNTELSTYDQTQLKEAISRQKFNDWKEGVTNKDYNFVHFMGFIENYLEDSLKSMVIDKKMTFIKRIENKAGEIIDMSGLELAEDGSINGRVIGKNKIVDVTTVLAGGYNVQCLHYRVLVK